jgi:hypothetical protein
MKRPKPGSTALEGVATAILTRALWHAGKLRMCSKGEYTGPSGFVNDVECTYKFVCTCWQQELNTGYITPESGNTFICAIVNNFCGSMEMSQ